MGVVHIVNARGRLHMWTRLLWPPSLKVGRVPKSALPSFFLEALAEEVIFNSQPRGLLDDR